MTLCKLKEVPFKIKLLNFDRCAGSSSSHEFTSFEIYPVTIIAIYMNEHHHLINSVCSNNLTLQSMEEHEHCKFGH